MELPMPRQVSALQVPTTAVQAISVLVVPSTPRPSMANRWHWLQQQVSPATPSHPFTSSRGLLISLASTPLQFISRSTIRHRMAPVLVMS